jgi:N-methylhydantoinase A/oxoprolinase/acetone carboxylase beta subunit
VYWRELGDRVDTAVFEGMVLVPSTTIEGPALLEYPNTVVAVRPGQRAVVDEDGSLTVHLEEGR